MDQGPFYQKHLRDHNKGLSLKGATRLVHVFVLSRGAKIYSNFVNEKEAPANEVICNTSIEKYAGRPAMSISMVNSFNPMLNLGFKSSL